MSTTLMTYLKSLRLHFKIHYFCKRIILCRSKKGTILITREPNYFTYINNALGIFISSINPKEIELNRVQVNVKKVKDVDELLRKNFGIDCKKLKKIFTCITKTF